MADGFAQIRDAHVRGVFREVLVDGSVRGGRHVRGRREIGFAGAEIDDIGALTPQTLRFDRAFHRGRHADVLHPLGEPHRVCGHTRLCDDDVVRFFSRNSTTGGTSPAIDPPSAATSLTSRELTYVYCSDGIMKTVSMSALRCRFISAICISNSKSETARRPRTMTLARRRCA